MSDTPQKPTEADPTAKTAEGQAPVKTDAKVTGAPATDTKTSEQKQPEATPEKPLPGLSVEKPKDKEAARAGAPEKYEWKIEGDPTSVARITGKFEPVARKLGLSSDEAHGVYDTFAGIMRETTKDLFKQWATTLQQDKEIGGEKLEESLGLANSMVAQYGDDELRGLLDQAGLRHNPAVVRLLVKMAKDVGGDRLPRVADRPASRSTPGAWDYPTMTTK